MIRLTDSLGNVSYFWKRANGKAALTGHTGIPYAMSNVFGAQTTLLEMAVEDSRNNEEMLAAATQYAPRNYRMETVRVFESREPAPEGRISVVVTDVFGNRGYVHRQTDGSVEYRSGTGVNLALPGKDSFLTGCRLSHCHVPMEMKLLLDGSFKHVELLEKDLAVLRAKQAELEDAVNVLAELVAGAITEDLANGYLHQAGYVHGDVDENSQIGSVQIWIDSIANAEGSREEAADFLEYFGVAVDPIVKPSL